ncbi:TetR/AcrR family transcriptional regulator [Streptomyces carpinensis]|uniref:TetR/AcrR family transcriptional regulator n=1 Tax=Streptomyces carpinensis TaxID=66369 RepID=A0ABV1WJE7_9ACTN|nr:TetR/AcrR family transcriptional regulator [Streptomyces carpinensis]
MGTAVSRDRHRPHDAGRTRREILAAARAEFAEAGYAGARMDEIAARTRTSKRMIYYYFGSKEGLFTAVLEEAYREIRRQEQLLDADEQDPVEAMRRLAELTFDHHEAHPDFVRLVSIENVHRGRHLARSQHLADLQTPALAVIERMLRRGRESGRITADVDAVGMHAFISSFCVFPVANRHTFAALFDRDLLAPVHRDRLRTMLGDLVVTYLTGTAAQPSPLVSPE